MLRGTDRTGSVKDLGGVVGEDISMWSACVGSSRRGSYTLPYLSAACRPTSFIHTADTDNISDNSGFYNS